MAVAQAELAIEQIEACRPSSARSIHEARKAIKRMRTIVRLLEAELGPAVCAREQGALRHAAAGLAGARDAEVMLATLDGLIERNPGALAGRRSVARIREHLSRERDRAERLAQHPATRIAAVNELRAFALRAGAWQLTEHAGLGSIDSGLRRIYREGRRRRRRAARARGEGMHAMHQWRKRVKDLRYAAEMLQRQELSARGSRSRRARARSEARWLHRLAARADELGEVLGEEHDLAVLGAWLRAEGKRVGAGRATRRTLERLISKRRSKLRKRALRDGQRLYRRRPGEFMERIGRAFAQTGPKLS